jgi:type IX secretion system PorP/SprF family membrane protein
VVHDQIGDVVNDTNVFFDLTYVFQVSDRAKLSLGVKAGLSFFSTDFNGFVYSDPLPDPAFAENLSRVFPNVGTGLFYFTDRFYFGFSAPNLFQSKYLDENSGVVTEGSEAIHYFMTSGYVFNLSKTLKFKPAFMAKAVSGAPLSLDVTANFLYNDKIELGVAYRVDDAFSGLFNIQVANGLRIGYAYDHTISNLGRFNSGSHEIMLLYNLSRTGRGYDKSPRFF